MAERSQGDWLETARKVLGDLNAKFNKIVQLAETLTKQAEDTKNAAERMRLIKSAEKFSNSAERMADLFNMAMKFSVGLGDEIRKQSDRDVDLDAKFNKQLTKIFEVEQYLATRPKQLPQVSSSAGDDDLDDELDGNSEPKGAHPRSEKKAFMT